MVSFSTAMPIDDLAPRLPPDRPFSGVAFDAAVNKSRNGQTMDNGEVIIRNWLARHKKSS
ncbi:hypothetical protein AGMMS49992_18660 [Clostridia bacterium]|nr:hypothetical protein AGMMS49992_18660 [Clostridia bacterium]